MVTRRNSSFDRSRFHVEFQNVAVGIDSPIGTVGPAEGVPDRVQSEARLPHRRWPLYRPPRSPDSPPLYRPPRPRGRVRGRRARPPRIPSAPAWRSKSVRSSERVSVSSAKKSMVPMTAPWIMTGKHTPLFDAGALRHRRPAAIGHLADVLGKIQVACFPRAPAQAHAFLKTRLHGDAAKLLVHGSGFQAEPEGVEAGSSTQ